MSMSGIRFGWLRSCVLAAPLLLGAAFGAPPSDAATDLLGEMTPEQRVGQLFLVTFEGSQIGEGSPIDILVRQGRVGGVLLSRQNDNFSGGEETTRQAAELTASLQELARVGTTAEGTPAPGTPLASENLPYVPLLIGIRLGIDGTLDTQFVQGLSEQSTPMALGATWDSTLAWRAGAQVGRELRLLGFNLLLGPSLDILESVGPETRGDLGVMSLGGDPFWVGQLGSEYIRGLRQGADGQVAVVAIHFPGMGNADRPAEAEVPTVRKSLEQLRQTELAPFLAVTSPGQVGGEPVDGLLVSHIRYQGLQGNIRETTRPISLDRQALGELLALEPLQAWRDGGGLLVSDSLGARAIRRFMDPREEAFNAVAVARAAFQAGEDMLLLDDFRNPDDADELTSVLETLDAFTEKYKSDPVFAEQVDELVLRILRMKLRLYDGTFKPDQIAAGGEAQLQETQAGIAPEVARNAATLISPTAEDVRDRLGVPELGDRIVFITDVRELRQCSRCEAVARPAVDSLEKTVAALYGSTPGVQVRSWNLELISTADLALYLGESPDSVPEVPIRPTEEVEALLDRANWLVFSVMRPTDGVFGSDALKLLLDRRPDLASEKKLVVFGMDVPYALDSTEISKLNAYYALFGQSASFMETAARLLFQDYQAGGASPVSVPGAGYELFTALLPNPAQVIPIRLRASDPEVVASTEETGFRIGDEIVLEAGPMLDLNGHLVPDGTVVEFVLLYQGESIPSTAQTTTINGLGSLVTTLDRVGLLTIQARSEPARTSDTLQLDVQEGAAAFVTVIAPTPLPTDTVPVAGAASEVPATDPAGVSNPPPAGGEPRAGLDSYLAALVGALAVGYGGWRVLPWEQAGRRQQVRVMVAGVIGAMTAYIYLALQLPGSPGASGVSGVVASLVSGIMGAALACLIVLGIERIRPPGEQASVEEGADEREDRG